MRVLVVASAWPSAAHPAFGSFVRQAADALAAAGVDVDRAVLSTPARGRIATPLKYAGLGLRAVAAAGRRRPDVIWAHFLVPTGTVARAAARVWRVPYVVTAHGTDVANAERSPRLRRATEAVVRDAAAVVAVSEDLASRLRALYGDLGGRLHVVSAGVDLDRFHDGDRDVAAAAVGWSGERPRLLAVGNLVPVKNHARLLVAYARARSALGGSLALVGDGPLRHALEAQVDALGLNGAVTFAGEVTSAELPRWDRATDAACLVSEREGLGLVAIEALATGRPVALTRTAGVAPAVTDGVTGALCDPADVDSIARALVAAARLDPGPAARAAAEPYGLVRETARMAEVLAGAVRPRSA